MFADELHLAAGVATVETQTAGGKRHTEVVGLGVLDLLQDGDARIRIAAVVVLLVVVKSGVEDWKRCWSHRTDRSAAL
jgi:hypothetical protein